MGWLKELVVMPEQQLIRNLELGTNALRERLCTESCRSMSPSLQQERTSRYSSATSKLESSKEAEMLPFVGGGL